MRLRYAPLFRSPLLIPMALNNATQSSSTQLKDGRRSVTDMKGKAVTTILKGHEEFRLDAFGKIISSNLEAVNVTGYEEWDVIGKHISIFYTPHDVREGLVEDHLADARRGKKINYTSWMLKKRNVTFWARLSIRNVCDEDENVVGFRVVLKDQTHRLINNNKLQRVKSEYRNLFDNPFIGIFKFRALDFKILLLNDKAENIVENKKAKKFEELFRSRSEFHLLMENLITFGKITAFEFELLHEEGRWVRIDCQLFSDEGFVEGVISDVTESKKQLIELERLNADLDNFIYRASHDLRSPLTTLMGLINLVEVDGQIDRSVYYKMMRDRITHLDQLLGDLAAITYNNQSELFIQIIDFTSLTRNLIAEFATKAIINVSVYADPNAVITSDGRRLFAILQNIASYSLRFRHPGIAAHKLAIDIRISDKKAIIRFEDNGRGIAADQLALVFGIFHKTTSEVIDTGLSLYMTKLYVEKIHGSIKVNSTLGVGTQFEIVIPSLG
jgi:PAS domain S-box-containing protein